MGPGVAERRASPRTAARVPVAGSAMGGPRQPGDGTIPSRHEGPERGYRSLRETGPDTRDRASPKTSASPFGAAICPWY